MGRLDITGHRGARGLWPENTLAGFAAARALGVDAIECDVILTADGRAAVTHDPTLDPDLVRDHAGNWIAPPGPAVASMTLAALRAFDVGRARPGSALARQFPRQRPVDGARIPVLEEVFAALAGSAVTLDVELKSEPGDADEVPAALAACVLAVAASWPAQRLAVRSFDWRGLLAVRRQRPALPLGFLTETTDPATLRRVLAEAQPGDTWAPEHAELSPASIAAAHAAGLRVEPWTVNEADDMRRLIDAGVDGLCTDYPDLARAVSRQRAVPPACANPIEG
jgi:glycerophosphoryl diester phosphodiesterase